MTTNMAVSSVQTSWLNWAQRPDSTKEGIDKSHAHLKKMNVSGWGVHNGDASYSLAGVFELPLLKKTILDAYPTRKEFYVLDIGAGNFQWNQAVAEFIEAQNDLPKDIKVHIIGIRGERGRHVYETDRCKIYNLGAFKVEELFAKFKEEGLDLVGKLDIVISRWCFRHLNDPVGTLQQIFNLLRPKTGYLILDGFIFLRNEESMNGGIDFNHSMTQLLIDMKIPFLTQSIQLMRSLNQFIIRRPDATECRIPMSYVDTECVGDGWQIGSQNVTRFQRKPQPEDKEEFRLYGDSQILSGDKQLYEHLKQNGVLNRDNLTWSPLYTKDENLVQPLLHKATVENDADKAQDLLEQANDINESNSEGSTPLHLAIQNGYFKLFQTLLNRGARIDLYDGKCRAVLHTAAVFDKSGLFLQDLFDAGADINAKGYPGKSALSLAIQAKNLRAVEFLIQKGAEISAADGKELKERAFNPLHQKGIVPFIPVGGGYSEVHHWIMVGHLVVLRYPGEGGIMYHYPNEYNKTLKRIEIDINPESRLLADGEWPSFLKEAGYEYVRFDKDKVAKIGCSETEKYTFGYEV